MASLDRFGLDVGVYGPLAEPETIFTLARFAEDVGFESIWLADHVVFPAKIQSRYPFSETGAFPAPTDAPLLEPIAAMGALVGATTRIRIGTAVLVMPYRHPVLLARMLITLDRFSNGRITLGAGVGWLREEFEALDSPDFRLRGKATDEALEIFRALSAGGEVAFDGEVYQFNAVHSVPGSVQKPHPPILIGGVSAPALRRVVSQGDGWLAVSLDAEEMPASLDALRQECARQGRAFDDLDLVYKIFLNPGAPTIGRNGRREMGSGSEAEIIDDLKAVLDAGFDKVIVRYRGDDAAMQMEQMQRFAAEIAPRL